MDILWNPNPSVERKVELDFSKYATKTDSKNVRWFDPSFFVKNTDLANFKSNIYKLDINKFKNPPTNLNNFKSNVDKLDVNKLTHAPVVLTKLSDVVKNDIVKKDVYKAKV